MNAQFCALPAEGARMAASRMQVMISSGTGSGLRRRKARAEYIASNSLISGIASPHAANSFAAYGSAFFATIGNHSSCQKSRSTIDVPDRLLALADEVIE